jgi:hypothetical protein
VTPAARWRVVGTAGLGASALVGHVLYPAAIGLLAVGRRAPTMADPTDWPAISVVVPAYREEGVIGARLQDLHANGYPGEVEVVVVADDAATAEAATGAGATVVHNATRVGKATALGIGVAATRHDVIVLTDANNRLTPGSLAALVRRLQEPGVGAVAGVKIEEDAGGEELYSRFEAWLKEREAVLGTTIGTCGELIALRREAWRPVPADIAVEDLWLALDLSERGHRVAYEPTARSIDPPVPGRQQWERRTRITAGVLVVLWRKRAILRRPSLVAAEVVGHKLWRSTLGPLSHVALLAVAVLRSPHSRLAALFVAGHLVGTAGLVVREHRRLPLPVALLSEVLFLQAVALGGMVRVAREGAQAWWPKPPR